MAASSSSLLLPSLCSSKTLISSRPKTLALVSPLSSSAFSRYSVSLPSPVTFSLFGKPRSVGSVIIRNVTVSSEIEQEDEAYNGEEMSFSPDLKLFVGNLPFNVDSAEIAGLFEPAGNVEMVEVIYDKQTGRSRGFGFVTMSTVEEVEAAVQQFNGYELDGRALRVNSGPPPRKDDFSSRGFRTGGNSNASGYSNNSGYSNASSYSNASNRVYVGNLSWAVDDSALETLFSEQGKVMEAKVVYDRESGRSRGFGFVTYSSADEVNGAISSLNGADLKGRQIRVTVAESKPRRQF